MRHLRFRITDSTDEDEWDDENGDIGQGSALPPQNARNEFN